MYRIMSSIIHFGVLLMISAVVAGADGFSHQPHLKPELERLALEGPSTMEEDSVNASLSAPPKWQRNPVFCCVCQDTVKQARQKIDLKIQQNINKLCSKFIHPVQLKCHLTAGKLKIKLLKTIFPGRTPKDTCRRKGKLCMY